MTQTIEKQLLDLEKQYWQAIKDKNVETIAELTDDSCIVAGAQGVGSLDRQELEAMMENAEWTLHRFELGKNAHVRLLSDDIAILAYPVREELTLDGDEPFTLNAIDSSAWIKRDGRWRCALHTESIAGDPFGRDRSPMH